MRAFSENNTLTEILTVKNFRTLLRNAQNFKEIRSMKRTLLLTTVRVKSERGRTRFIQHLNCHKKIYFEENTFPKLKKKIR